MTPWWQTRCELSWLGLPWNQWVANSRTHIGYQGRGDTAREAVENLEEGIRRRPYNCYTLDGTPLGAMGADGVLRKQW